MKRIIDVVLASFGMLLLAFPLAIVALSIRWKLGAPVLFRQARPGLDGRLFELIKFRTMTDARDAAGQLLENSARHTPFGRFLRASSLDELPELWNVLRGDMSLVGPRPLLPEYLPLYSALQARRHEMRPGLTGWAQINGRNSLSWEDKFALDVWYVDNHSLWLDAKVLLLTVKKVFARENINATTEVTMSRFTGTPAGSKD